MQPCALSTGARVTRWGHSRSDDAGRGDLGHRAGRGHHDDPRVRDAFPRDIASQHPPEFLARVASWSRGLS